MGRFSWFAGVFIALSAVFSGGVLAAKAPEAPLPPDVRVVVDISGSMKKTDPRNLRRPAVDLLIKMFPSDAKAGVWTFGQGVNLLIPHANADTSWRGKALKKVPNIDSVGLFTNIGGALEKAGYDLDVAKAKSRVSVILLTDGKVDISKNLEDNVRERERILKDLLPRFRSAGVRIHTVALSEDADKELLEALAVGTGGVAAIATSAEELTKVFVQAFDQAVPAERVPFEGKKFQVDGSIEEFTALIFRDPSEATRLASPTGSKHDAAAPGENVRWFKGDNYDLITVKSPQAGNWEVLTNIGPASRVTVISDLKMVISPLESNLILGDSPEVATAFRDGDKEINDAAFLKLLDIFAEVTSEGRESVRATLSSQGEEPPADGVIAAQLPAFDKPGEYNITFRAEGKTFSREQTQHVTVRELFAVAEQKDDSGGHVISVSAVSSTVDVAQTQLAAKIRTPGGKVAIQPLQSIAPGNWFIPLVLEEEGNYQVSIEATGKLEGGKTFSVSLPKLNIEKEAPIVTPAQPNPEIATSQPEPSAEPITESAPASEEGGWTLNTYLMIAGIVIAHIVVIGLGVVVYRRVREGAKSKILADESGDNADLPQPTSDSNANAASAAGGALLAAATTAAVADDLGLDELDQIPVMATPSSDIESPAAAFDIDDDIIDIAPGGDDDKDELAL